jgi:hypothetical protein
VKKLHKFNPTMVFRFRGLFSIWTQLIASSYFLTACASARSALRDPAKPPNENKVKFNAADDNEDTFPLESRNTLDRLMEKNSKASGVITRHMLYGPDLGREEEDRITEEMHRLDAEEKTLSGKLETRRAEDTRRQAEKLARVDWYAGSE